jgi:hypothetical protein
VLVPEMNLGQMIEDVRLSLDSRLKIVPLNRRVGAFAPEEIRTALQHLFEGRS